MRALPAEAGDRPFGSLFRRSAKIPELLAREIVHDIASRGLKPGAMLPPESLMLKQYRIGRASLREALRILEIYGMIVIRPGLGGGPVVAPLGSVDFGRTATFYFHVTGGTLRELMQARLLLEPVSARLAAETRDPELLEALNEVIEEGRAVPVDDEHAWLPVANKFHGIIAGMTGNRVLDMLVRSLRDISAVRTASLVYPERDEARRDHEAIAREIMAGRGARAERLMRQHMEQFCEYALERFPGVFDEVVDWR
jgi:DNA-binding FadR family transcriptional regulator